MNSSRAWILVTLALTLGSCVMITSPDTPANAAIQFISAIQVGDMSTVESLVCSSATDRELDFGDPSTFGDLQAYVEADFRSQIEESNAYGGASEYELVEDLDIPADEAWTEIDFVGDTMNETWRLHMVREDGKWKACDAELRP
jgi:hypothetical protein